MKTILHLTSSIFGEGGVSSRLAEDFVSRIPAARVIRRDLAREPVPHLDAERFGIADEVDRRHLGLVDAAERLAERVVDHPDLLISVDGDDHGQSERADRSEVVRAHQEGRVADDAHYPPIRPRHRGSEDTGHDVAHRAPASGLEMRQRIVCW